MSEDRYRSLVAAATSVVWTTDASGAFVEPQSAWETYTGQPWDEHRGWGWARMVHPADREGVEVLWERALRTRSLYESQGRLWHAASGKYRYYFARGVPVLNADGSIREWVGFITDIHEQQKAEEALRASEARLTHIVESISDAFMVVDHEWRYTYVNERAAQMVGMRQADLIGKVCWEVFPEGMRIPTYEAAQRAVCEQQPVRLEDYYAPLDLWFELRLYPNVGGGVSGFITDISDRKRSQQVADRFKFIADNANDALFLVAEDLRFAYANRVACERLGYVQEEVRRLSLPDVQVAFPASRMHEMFAQARHERIPPFEGEHRRKDGTTFPVEVGITHVTFDGRPLIFKVARDITERKKAEASVQQHARITETLNRVGTSVASELDRAQIVQTVTDAATELTGAQFGAFFYNVVDPQSGESYMLHTLSGARKESFAKFPNPRATELFGPTFRGERPVRLADVTQDPRYSKNPPYHGIPPGHLPVRSYLAVPVKARNGDVLGGLFFGHARTGMFSEQHEQLVEGIASWASVALENARLFEQAQEASRMKDEFLAVLSHELRTPLNAILGWSRILRERRMTDEKIDHALAVVERNAKLQTQLVEDLLDVSRIVSGKLRLEFDTVDLPAVIEAAIDAVRPAATNKGLELEVRLDANGTLVKGDASRLEQVVWNLLTNAVKFTPDDGRVSVDLRRSDGHAEIVVADTGQGIAREFLPHVFDRFRQADATSTRVHSGLGLGLALVRALTEAHGGTVSVVSAGVGRGATFTIRLPLQAVESSLQGDSADRATPASAVAGLRVLVVDDDADARELLAVTLESAGARPVLAGSAREALRIVRDESPDLLLADIGMPSEDGYDLIRMLRALPEEAGGRLPAVAVTAYASPKDRDAVRRAGYDAHVAKPVEPVQLLSAITGAMMRD